MLLDIEAHTSVVCSGVLDSLAVELKASKDFSKLYAGIAILGYICAVSDPICSRAFSHLLTLLTHRYPKIRKAAAEQVYLVLLQNESLVSEENTKRYSKLFQKLLGMLKTTSNVTSSKAGKKSTTVDENESYSSIVESTGF
ncbi:tubulin-folding cofactor D-like [Hibiscus syriacus]|uniref:tubulin-folding cofactor D-like n=1 Tax=Hibiscus syriacus TaxID=106335 RepID=UPI001923C433|nr:tubulin-folding cofactor D-like [Hibiscus syriacus]